jgi:hypothetical protein
VNFATKNPVQIGQPAHGVPRQKAIFFNDKTGVLMVRATLADMDIIENALQVLNITPPQIMIETYFVELKAGAAYEKDLLLRMIATNPANSVITVTELMSDPQFKALIEALGNRERGAPSSNRSEQQIREGSVLTGVLTEKQMQEVLKALKEDGVRFLLVRRSRR